MSETLFVLRETATSEPQTFGVFPGVWTPGVAKTATELGLTDEQAKALIDELGLPIDVKPARKPKPDEQTPKPEPKPEKPETTGGN